MQPWNDTICLLAGGQVTPTATQPELSTVPETVPEDAGEKRRTGFIVPARAACFGMLLMRLVVTVR